MLKKISSARFLVGLVASLAIAGGAYAFTASNTVPTSNVGAGSGTVSGYTVTNLHYGLNSTHAVEHRLDDVHRQPGRSRAPAPARSACRPRSRPAARTRYTCTTNVAGDTVTCATTSPQLTADKLSSVTVVAAQ